jgi:hypothetical protein
VFWFWIATCTTVRSFYQYCVTQRSKGSESVCKQVKFSLSALPLQSPTRTCH